MPRRFLCLALLTLAACSADPAPTTKEMRYDPQTNRFVPSAPCPDWSHSASSNYDNSLHSNYGCAVVNNMGQQIADPADIVRGNGNGKADTEAATRAIQRYRSGEIPEPFTPMQGGLGSE